MVRELLEPLGAHVDVLAMQPGGPQALATYRGVPVVCFPGNPVSSQLSFELFVAPMLRELAGLPAPRRATLTLDAAVRSIRGGGSSCAGGASTGIGWRPSRDRGRIWSPRSRHPTLIIEMPEDVVDLAAGDSVETWEL